MSGEETLYDLAVNGKEAVMTLTTMGTPREVPVEWDDHVRGAMGKWLLMKEKGLEPEAKLSFRTFTFDYGKVATATLEVMGMEETELLDGGKATYLHVVNTVDVMPSMKVHEWLNDNYDTMKTSVSIMGITIESFRTTRERAQSAGGMELKADLMMETILRANVQPPRPYRLTSILYRFQIKDPEQSIPKSYGDNRQEFLENDGRTAKILIHARMPEKSQIRPMTNPSSELLEYLEPNAFIQSDYPALRAKALDVVGEDTDAWKSACLLERFVYDYIEDKNYGTGFATAAEVFENPRGDCSEHGVLLAALCRATGIPARVAIGYMYIAGIFGGHMWAEVWIQGDWYPIDGVVGIGRVGPTHITFSTSSLKEGGLIEAFANVIQYLGNLEISILEFTHGDKTVVVDEGFKDYRIEGDNYTNTLHGVSITKPEGYEFTKYERDYSELTYHLVEISGKSHAELTAFPIPFHFTMDDLKDLIKQDGSEILSELPRRIRGRKGVVFMLKQKSKTYRALVLPIEDTCYALRMRIDDEDRDILDFERMVKSLEFSD
jgi:hypothetical protein